jgi:hypothetical protein
VNFKFYPLRFEFTAAEPVFFPPGKAANTLRGALGTIFRAIACTPACRAAGSSRTCEDRSGCPYARVFEPVAIAPGPSGLGDPPRPFAFRARHLDGRHISSGETFSFGLNLFSLEPEALTCFVSAFAALAREGVGPDRRKAVLQAVRRLAAGESPEQTLYAGPGLGLASRVEPVTLSLDPLPAAPPRIQVRFLSPTELKHDHRIAETPEFPVLFGRIRDRIGTLRSLYGEGPLEMDYQASGVRAATVRMTHCQTRREEVKRRSSRTGQVHSLGGFTGTADYEGDLREFIPWLLAARYTGVGRQAVWGKGEISIDY